MKNYLTAAKTIMKKNDSAIEVSTAKPTYHIAATINSLKNSSVSVKPDDGHGPAVIERGVTRRC